MYKLTGGVGLGKKMNTFLRGRFSIVDIFWNNKYMFSFTSMVNGAVLVNYLGNS